MSTKPMLFNGPMARAILEGRKTQTRRIVKPQPGNNNRILWRGRKNIEINIRDDRVASLCPYGQPGDLIWVRETFIASKGVGGYAPGSDPDRDPDAPTVDVIYRADDGRNERTAGPWTPSIHMPRWASRITLLVTDVRVERLQDISSEDEDAEGFSYCIEDPDTPAGRAFSEAEHYAIAGVPMKHSPERFGLIAFFESAGIGWEANPWVWVIEFRPILANVDDVLADPARYGIEGEAA